MITHHRRGHRVLEVLVVPIAFSVLAVGCTAPSPLTPEQQVDQIVAFVEQVRGHGFVTPPVVQFLSDSDFRQAVLDNVATAEPAVRDAEVAFKALGWLPPGGDLYTQYKIAFGGAVVGFYDPSSNELKVRGTDLTPYRREVIAHELTHALDDQLFGLDEDFHDGLLGEQTFSALVAIEGDAVRTQQAYYGSMSGLEQVQDILEQLSAGSDPALLAVPIALLTYTQAPYLRGGTFMYEVAATQGVPGGLDAALNRYPSTAEQAFDTTKYLTNEPAVAVPTPPADGPAVVSGTLGQFLLTEILKEGLALDSVDPVTFGWAGDAYVTWRSPTLSCLRLDTKMDTPEGATALQSALTIWASRHAGATVDAVSSAAVRLTACA